MPFTRKSNRITIPADVANALGNDFSNHELQALSTLGTVIDLDAGALLMTEGRHGAEALVIVAGTAVVSRGDEIVATVSAGDVIGEMALLTGEPRSASVVATTPIQVVVLNPREFASLTAQCPRLDREFRKLADSRTA